MNLLQVGKNTYLQASSSSTERLFMMETEKEGEREREKEVVDIFQQLSHDWKRTETTFLEFWKIICMENVVMYRHDKRR